MKKGRSVLQCLQEKKQLMEILMKQYEKEQQVLRQMEEHGWEAWFVGGCVRDALRGKLCDDIDITTNATPQEVTDVLVQKISSKRVWLTAR